MSYSTIIGLVVFIVIPLGIAFLPGPISNTDDAIGGYILGLFTAVTALWLNEETKGI